LFEGPLPRFKYSPEHVRRALSKERLGGTCLINFCAGGETLLAKEVLSYVTELLKEGHYCMVVTNGTISSRLEEFAQLPPELTRHLFFKFSYHYLELKEKNLFETFFNNIRTVRDAGCSFTLELTPSDDAIPYIEDIKARALKELGAWNHVTIARDEKDDSELPMLSKLSREEYKRTWGVFDSKLFDYKYEIFEKKRKEFCYAGDWSFYLNLLTGEMSQCYKSYYNQNIFDDLSKPIVFRAIGANCKEHHCYNGHLWIALGDIPTLQSPTYAEMRNRVCADGTEWLSEDMRNFMSSKLYESNRQYNYVKRLCTNFRYRHPSIVGVAWDLYSKIARK